MDELYLTTPYSVNSTPDMFVVTVILYSLALIYLCMKPSQTISLFPPPTSH